MEVVRASLGHYLLDLPVARKKAPIVQNAAKSKVGVPDHLIFLAIALQPWLFSSFDVSGQ